MILSTYKHHEIKCFAFLILSVCWHFFYRYMDVRYQNTVSQTKVCLGRLMWTLVRIWFDPNVTSCLYLRTYLFLFNLYSLRTNDSFPQTQNRSCVSCIRNTLPLFETIQWFLNSLKHYSRGLANTKVVSNFLHQWPFWNVNFFRSGGLYRT